MEKVDRRAKYDATHTKHFSIKLNLKTDAAIISALENADSVQGYIKQALREKIERERH